ncbi:MAG: FHA domain-containing protein [Pseudomonadales bacterium]
MSDTPILVLSEQLVSKTSDIVERRKQIEELLEKAEDLKTEVNADIYERVADDYKTRLADIAVEYHPLRDEMISDLQCIRNEESRLRNELGEINDMLEEIRFRAKVGEFSEEELRQKEEESKGDAGQLERQIATIEKTFETASELLGSDIDKIAAAAEVEQQSKPADESESQPVSDAVDDGSGSVENKLQDSAGGSQNSMSDEAAVQVIHELAEEEQAEPPLLKEVAREAVSSLPEPVVEDQMFPNAGLGGDTVFLNAPAAAMSPVNDRNDDQLQTAVLICSKPAGNQWHIHAQGLVLGRSDSCDVMIAGRSVSRRHAIIQASDGNFFVEDVSSGGGVEVNSKRVEKKQQLNSGDKIEVGADVFVFEVQ